MSLNTNQERLLSDQSTTSAGDDLHSPNLSIQQQQHDDDHTTARPAKHPKNNNLTFAVFMVVLAVFIGCIMYLLWRIDEASVKETKPLYVLHNATIYASPSLAQFGGASSRAHFLHPTTITTSDPTIIDHETIHRRGERVKLGALPFSLQTTIVIGDDGRFYDVGGEVLLEAEHYKDLPRVDMNGQVITPGFHDAHGHMVNFGLSYLEPDLRTATSPTQFMQQLLAFAKKNNIDPKRDAGYWLIGGRWDESKWGEDPDYDYHLNPDGSHPMPFHQILDREFTGMGVALKRIDGHACFVNKVVLDKLNLPKEDPPGGQILRDKDGNPTGVLIDYACELVWARVEAQPTKQHKLQAIVRAQQELLKLGLTTIHDASILDAELFASQVARKPTASFESIKSHGSQMTLYDPFPMRVYGMLDIEGVCAAHNYTCPDPYPFGWVDYNKIPTYRNGTKFTQAIHFEAEQRTTFPELNFLPKITSATNGKFSMSAAKLMSDGALGSRGAFLIDDYSDKPGHKGTQMYSVEQLNFVVTTLVEQGFQVCTHAIGDGAVKQVIDAYKTASDATKRKTFVATRHRIEHFQIVPEDISDWYTAVNRLQIIPSMQPIHAVQDRSFAESRLGKDRLEKQAYIWREAERLLDIVPLGTDFPVSLPNVLANLYAATTMEEIGVDLPPFLPDHTLSMIDALMGITYDAAFAMRREGDLGTIAPGRVADFVVIDRDWVNMRNGGPDEHTEDPAYVGPMLKNTTVLATFVDGNVVYESEFVKMQKTGKTTHAFHTVGLGEDEENENTNVVTTKQPWFANKLYRSTITTDAEYIEGAEEMKLLAYNQLKSFNFQQHNVQEEVANNQYHLDQKQFASLLDNINTIFGEDITQQRYLTADLEEDVENNVVINEIKFWYDLRFVPAPHHFAHIYHFFITTNYIQHKNNNNNSSNQQQNTIPSHVLTQQQAYFDGYNTTFITYAHTNSKHLDEDHHHDKLPTPEQYRAHVVYPVKNGAEGEVIQPRVPPCVDHSCTREYARRMNHVDHNVPHHRITEANQLQYGSAAQLQGGKNKKFIVVN